MKRFICFMFGALLFTYGVNAAGQFVNGDFETEGGWQVELGGGPPTPTVTLQDTEAIQGDYCAMIENVTGNTGTPRYAYIRQAVVVIADTLHYWIRYWLDRRAPAMGVRLITEGGDTIYLEYHEGTGSTEEIDWTERFMDVSDFKGEVVTVEVFLEDLSSSAGMSTHDGWIRVDDFYFMPVSEEFTPPEVEVISPNGGEAWGVGELHSITWYAYDTSTVVMDSIYYTTDGGTNWLPLAWMMGNPGSYEWMVPNTPSDLCMVKVVAFDPWGNRGEDVSDSYFTIVPDTIPPTVNLISPNGGELWGTGDVYQITWTATDNGAIAGDSLYYSIDGGATWVPITYQEGNPGSYWWRIPNTPSATCMVRVKVFDIAGLSGEDTSDGYFTIYQREIPTYRYAVIVSEATLSDPDWAAVVDALVQRHNGEVFTYSATIWPILDEVAEYRPDYIAFVCKLEEADPSFIQEQVWPFTRMLDDDPYGDAIWGIVTGCDASDAMKLVTCNQPLWIRTVLGGTACCDARYFPQGIATSEATYGRYWIKYPDAIQPVQYDDGPTDRTAWLVSMLNGDSLIFGDSVDIFFTSGHGNYNVWQLHYPTPGEEGYFWSSDYGFLFGETHEHDTLPIVSPNPKIYFGLGNCNIAQIFGPHCMAPAWIRNGGAVIYCGYVILEGPYSYQLGATKAYFCRQDHYSFPVAFYLGNQVFKFDLDNNTPGIGEPDDLDGAAIYCDPALDARIPDDAVYDTLLYTKELIVIPGDDRDTIIFRITMNRTGRPGYTGKWGYRSPIVLFPWRVDSVEVIDTDALDVVITDNFALMYVWYEGQPDLLRGEQRYVKFVARRIIPGVEERIVAKPTVMQLFPNVPNPFHNRTTIAYHIIGENVHVTINIYDLSGRLVRKLVDATRSTGIYEVEWDGTNSSGNHVPAGVYFIQLRAGDQQVTRKAIVVR